MADRELLCKAGRELVAKQLVWGTSGNMSTKADDNKMIITASGTNMGELAVDDFVEVEIFTGKVLGTKKASKETPMHTGIYSKRPDVNAIVHSSPFYATLFACSNEPIASELFVESMYYLENIAYIDYFHPGSIELAEAITKEAKKANIIMMRHHGVVVFDKNLKEAMVRLETLEIVCKMLLQASGSGIKLNKIPEKVVKSFLEESGYRERQVLPK